MMLGKAESRVYAAGKAIQATLSSREGVLLRQLMEATGGSYGYVHKAVGGLVKKRMAGWPMKDKNRRKGALRFWEVRRKA